MSLLQEQAGRIFAYRRPVDMRKGFGGLESVILRELGQDPLSGDMFVFISRTGHLMKCFLWDRTGYVIISKRLERGRFQLMGSMERVELDKKRWKMLLDGICVGGIPANTQNI